MNENETTTHEEVTLKKPRAASFLLFLPIALGIVGLVAYLATIDRTPLLTEAVYENALSKWTAAEVGDYDMTIDVEGALPGVVEIEVRGGEVTSMQRDGETPSDRRTWSIWSVDGQFDMIDREFDIADDPQRGVNATPETKIMLRAAFESELGYPLQFRRMVSGSGVPDMGWRVTHFEHR